MRPDVLDLKAFYASPLGKATAALICSALPAFRPGDRVLAIGYGLPYLDTMAQGCERAIAAMPARQGAVAWPDGVCACNRVCLVDVDTLPFVDAVFDHVVLIHCLEFAGRVGTTLAETARVLAPAGQLHIIVPNRASPWCRAEATPFGNGRPFSAGQLERVMEDAGLTAEHWNMALMLPPVRRLARWLRRWEGLGRRFWRTFGGVYVVTAKKALFKRRPNAPAHTALEPIRVPALRPAAALVPSKRGASQTALLQRAD